MPKNSSSFFRLSCLLLIAAGFLGHHCARAQGENGYVNEIANLPDEKKIKRLLEEAEKIKYIRPDEAENLLKAAERIASLNDLTVMQGDICINLAAFYWYKGEFVKSFDFSRKALDIFSLEKDTLGMANSFMAIGIGYSEFGLLTVSAEYLLEALHLYETQSDTHGIVSVYVNLADNYSDQKQYDLARMYLQRAERMAPDKGGNQYIDILLNTAALMAAVGDYRNAVTYYNRVVESATKSGYMPAKLWALTELSGIALKNGDLQLSESLADSTFESANQMGDHRSLTKILTIRSKVFRKKGAFEEAMESADEAQILADRMAYHNEALELLLLRSELFENMGKTDKSLEVLKRYVHLQDSVDNANKNDKLSTLALLYETDKRDSEIKKLKNEQLTMELDAQRDKLTLYIFLIFVSFLIVFSFNRIKALRVRKKANSLLEAQREKLHKANIRLEDEKRMAENANRAKSEFLATMTHELRTPLNAVLGLTELIDRANKDPEMKEMLNSLRFSGNNLLNIINNILDYKSFERGIIDINTEPVDLIALQDQLVKSTLAMLGDKPIEVRASFDPTTPRWVEADKLRLTQIFTNLLGNSVKFTHSGFINFSISQVQNDNNEEFYQFVIEDSGEGMPREALENVFDSFYRVPNASNKSLGGTGLGLSIVKMLTELMGGTIMLESEPGLGTKFILRIPLYAAEDHLVEEQTGQEPKAIQAAVTPKNVHVLVVDDNEINLFVAGKLIDQAGFKSTLCESGTKAIELCESNTYDIVLMDLQMPGMDGIEAASILRQIRPEMPVVALTAGEKDEFYMQNHGDTIFSAFLRKPFETDVLMDLINRKSTRPEA